MARLERLTPQFVEEISDPGRYGDGRGANGLSLRVRSSRDGQTVRKTWEQRVWIGGHVTTLGLGPVVSLSLSAARSQAAANMHRINSATQRVSALDRRLAELAFPTVGGTKVIATNNSTSVTPPFKDVAEEYIDAQLSGWKPGSKTETQTRSLLNRYVLPSIGNLPVSSVEAAHVHDILSPIWLTKVETSKKLKRLVSSIFTVAIAKGHRDDNPVERAAIGLGRQRAVVQHSAAVPHSEVRDVLEYVRGSRSYKAKKLATQLLILTATRTSEVRGARWREVDIEGCVWTIPAERMKGGREHRIPLSMSAQVVMGAAGVYQQAEPDALIFTDANDRPLSQDSIRQLVKRRYPDATAHGFRSSFRDWVAEMTDYPAEIAEHALAHLEGSATVRAYLRTDMFERRRGLMDDWAAYVTSNP